MKNHEIDKLIAEKVLGLTVKDDNVVRDGKRSGIPSYSQRIEHAWLVVEKLYEKTEIRMFVSNNFHPLWEARCKNSKGDWIGHGFDEVTAPLAICKAALNAVGIEVNS